MFKSYFFFFRLMHYTAFLMAIECGLCICYLPSHFAHRGITSFFVFLCMALFRRASFLTTFCGLYFQSSLHIITNYSSSLYRPSVGSFSCTAIQGIRQLAYFRTNTGKTLGKLHWKSKIPLQRNGMAAIPKIKVSHLTHFWGCLSESGPTTGQLLSRVLVINCIF